MESETTVTEVTPTPTPAPFLDSEQHNLPPVPDSDGDSEEHKGEDSDCHETKKQRCNTGQLPKVKGGKSKIPPKAGIAPKEEETAAAGDEDEDVNMSPQEKAYFESLTPSPVQDKTTEYDPKKEIENLRQDMDRKINRVQAATRFCMQQVAKLQWETSDCILVLTDIPEKWSAEQRDTEIGKIFTSLGLSRMWSNAKTDHGSERRLANVSFIQLERKNNRVSFWDTVQRKKGHRWFEPMKISNYETPTGRVEKLPYRTAMSVIVNEKIEKLTNVKKEWKKKELWLNGEPMLTVSAPSPDLTIAIKVAHAWHAAMDEGWDATWTKMKAECRDLAMKGKGKGKDQQLDFPLKITIGLLGASQAKEMKQAKEAEEEKRRNGKWGKGNGWSYSESAEKTNAKGWTVDEAATWKGSNGPVPQIGGAGSSKSGEKRTYGGNGKPQSTAEESQVSDAWSKYEANANGIEATGLDVG